MQEVWFAVARRLRQRGYQPTAKFTTLAIHHCACTRMIDMIRASHRLQSLEGGADPADSGGSSADGSLLDHLAADSKLEPPAEVQSQDEAAALLRAVAQLPPEQRAAFLLQAEGELSVEEITVAATGSNFETVKSRAALCESETPSGIVGNNA